MGCARRDNPRFVGTKEEKLRIVTTSTFLLSLQMRWTTFLINYLVDCNEHEAINILHLITINSREKCNGDE